MTVARREIVDAGAVGVYHCMARCVRRAFLCGFDAYSGKDYDHRKSWIQNRLQELSAAFGLDVFAYAVMSNHLHVVVRNRPDVVAEWSDRDVARRWLTIFPKQRRADGSAARLAAGDIAAITADAQRVAELRSRLSDISWFMKSLNEFVARSANREDGCKGRFWEGRFKCQRLLDESAVLACMAYVDLNPVRAKIADSLEDSQFTSVFDRIVARRAREHVRQIDLRKRAGEPVTQKQAELVQAERNRANQDRWLVSLNGPGSPFRGLTEGDYLRVLDWTGRQLHGGKPGVIAAEVAPILESLAINTQHWLRTVERYGSLFHRVAGRVENMMSSARNVGRRWFRGLGASAEAFALPAAPS
jgi:REP element-mobilizing transposase RayT